MAFPYVHQQLSTQPIWILLIIWIGFFTILKNLISLLILVFKQLFRPSKNLESYGSWALITGATDGIGKAFAFQLARRGLNLVLVSRNSNKLRKTAMEIQAEFPSTKVSFIELDFKGDLSVGVQDIEKLAEELEIGILINNVGVTQKRASFFHEVSEEEWMNIIKVNLEGTTLVTRAVLPRMIERRRGAVVNIGSGSACVVPSYPLTTVYAATKAYIDQLSRSLHGEYKGLGIHIQCQIPLFVATKMVSKLGKRPSLFTPAPEAYAQAAIRRIGYESRCCPFWAHSLQWLFVRLIPGAILDAWLLSVGIKRRARHSTQ